MTDEETVRKGILLEDFAAAQIKLQTLQVALRKESVRLVGIVDYLRHSGECPSTVASALDGYLSGPLSRMLQAMEAECEEKEMLRRMLAEIGIVGID